MVEVGASGEDEFVVCEQSVLEDDSVLSKESDGDGDRERARSLTSVLREGILGCLSSKLDVNCYEDQTLR